MVSPEYQKFASRLDKLTDEYQQKYFEYFWTQTYMHGNLSGAALRLQILDQFLNTLTPLERELCRKTNL